MSESLADVEWRYAVFDTTFVDAHWLESLSLVPPMDRGRAMNALQGIEGAYVALLDEVLTLTDNARLSFVDGALYAVSMALRAKRLLRETEGDQPARPVH